MIDWAVTRDREKKIVARRIGLGRLWIIYSASPCSRVWVICWTQKGAAEAMLAAQMR